MNRAGAIRWRTSLADSSVLGLKGRAAGFCFWPRTKSYLVLLRVPART